MQQGFAGPITLTTARQFTRKDSPPALFYVHSNHTPPASPETSRKGVFQGQSFSKNQMRCDARDSVTHTGSVTSMISLTTLLASATVAAAAKKVEDAPAPGIVDTVLGPLGARARRRRQVRRRGDRVDARHGSGPEIRRGEGVSVRCRRLTRAPRGPSCPRRGGVGFLPPPLPSRAPFALRAVRTLGVTHGVELTRG